MNNEWVKMGQTIQRVPFDKNFTYGVTSKLSGDAKTVVVVDRNTSHEVATVYKWDEEGQLWYPVKMHREMARIKSEKKNKVFVSHDGKGIFLQKNHREKVGVERIDSLPPSAPVRGEIATNDYSTYILSDTGETLVQQEPNSSSSSCVEIYDQDSQGEWVLVGDLRECTNSSNQWNPRDMLYYIGSVSISGDGNVLSIVTVESHDLNAWLSTFRRPVPR